jgi:uncharacterized membrane protein YgdD (TMEM256/DUF423 family)
VPEFKKFLVFGAGLAALSVVFGAFGAHSLEKHLQDIKLLATFETAARYQFYHALGLILVFMLSQYDLNKSLLSKSGWFMFFGTTLFSGSLYIYVFSGIKAFAMITPIGGLLMIIAWVLMLLAAVKKA